MLDKLAGYFNILEVTCPVVGRLLVGAAVIVHLAAGLLRSAVGIEIGVPQWPVVAHKTSSVVSTIIVQYGLYSRR